MPGEVTSAFANLHPDSKGLSSPHKINLHYDVAKFLLMNQYPHLVDGLECRAAAQHDTDMDMWGLILEDISAAKDISQYVLFLLLGFIISSLP